MQEKCDQKMVEWLFENYRNSSMSILRVCLLEQGGQIK